MEDLVFRFNAGTMTEVASMRPSEIAFWYRRAAAYHERTKQKQ